MPARRRTTIRRRWLVLAAVAVCAASSAATGQSGVQSGATHFVPWDFPSIQAAHDAASSGDTILVAPGTWLGQHTITKAVTLASYYLPTGNAFFIGATILDGDDDDFVIEIPSGAEDRPTIVGFTIRNAGDGILPRAMFDLLYCRVTDNGDGVDYENGSGGLVRFCTFELNSDDGIDLDHSVGVVIEHCIIRDNGDDGIEIRMQAHTGPMLEIVIHHNAIYGNEEDGIQLIHYDVPTNRTFEITRNAIFDNDFAGIGMMDDGDSDEDYRAADIPETIFVFNNTFAGNSHGITGGDATLVVNNIFVDHPAIAVKGVDAASVLAYNLYFGNGTDHSASNVDQNSSVFADALLGLSLDLLPGSPAIDAGTAYYPWQGMTALHIPPGTFQGTAPDMGAFESGSGPPTDPPDFAILVPGTLGAPLQGALKWTGAGVGYTIDEPKD
jgi:hypothetical protein